MKFKIPLIKIAPENFLNNKHTNTKNALILYSE